MFYFNRERNFLLGKLPTTSKDKDKDNGKGKGKGKTRARAKAKAVNDEEAETETEAETEDEKEKDKDRESKCTTRRNPLEKMQADMDKTGADFQRAHSAEAPAFTCDDEKASVKLRKPKLNRELRSLLAAQDLKTSSRAKRKTGRARASSPDPARKASSDSGRSQRTQRQAKTKTRHSGRHRSPRQHSRSSLPLPRWLL